MIRARQVVDCASGIFLCTLPIGPHIGTTPAASLAGKSLLKIRQPDIIGPSIAADRSPESKRKAAGAGAYSAGQSRSGSTAEQV